MPRSFTNDAAGLPTVDHLVTTIATYDLAHNAANSGFKQSGTGAIERLIESKLKETVSILDFGAKINTNPFGTSFMIENDAAIIAANNYCTSTGKTLDLGNYGDVLDFGVAFSLAGNYSVISNGHLRLRLDPTTPDYTVTFITVGGIANFMPYVGYFKFRRISSTSYITDTKQYPNFTGICFTNITKSLIDLTGEGVELFGTGVEFKGINSVDGYIRGVADNVVHLPICSYAQRSIFLNAAGNDGFVNSNIFYGGGSYLQVGSTLTYGISLVSFVYGSGAGNASINCNLFQGFVFEMGGGTTGNNIPVFASGSVSDNIFRDFRNENNKNSGLIFFKSTSSNVRRNFFYPLFNDVGEYKLRCTVIDAVSATFNVYKTIGQQNTEHFAGKLKLHSFSPVTTYTLTTIKGLDAYELTTGVLNKVAGFSTGDATITSSSFKLLVQNIFFGKMVSLGKNDYMLINTLQYEEADILSYVYLVPFKNGSIVTHSYASGLVTDTFVKNLKNQFLALLSINGNIMALQDADTKINNSHFVWFDLQVIDSVLIMFGRGVDLSTSPAPPVGITWEKLEISIGSNTLSNQTLEAEVSIFTDESIVGEGTEESPLSAVSKKITSSCGTSGTIVAPGETPIKGIIVTGSSGSTFAIGTTVSPGNDILTGTIGASGVTIHNEVFYYLANQTLYFLSSPNPITVILPV